MRSAVREVGGTRVGREDLLIAALAGAAGILEILIGGVTDRPAVAVAAMVGMAVALVFRRRAPLLAGPVALLLLLGQSAAGVDTSAQVMTTPVIVIGLYSMGRYAESVPSLGGLGVSVALVTAVIAVDGSGVSDLGFGWLLVCGPWLTGQLVRRHAATAAAADEQARRVARTAQQRIARAAEEERVRIARELHDIVSHGLTAMVVQATAAEQLVDADPGDAKAAMRRVQTTGREAMQEMKHLLGLLRATEDAPRDPQPALEDLADLVEAARAAGSEVDLRISGAPRQLPRGLALSVYRIAQEALTNVRKHAGDADAEVHLQFQPTSLCLEVLDRGERASAQTAVPGHGLTGMRERAELYGGHVEAAPRSDRPGWRVRAEFPLAAP